MSDSGIVKFEYVKSNSYRCIHIDGALGGVTPNGEIHMALYNERVMLPRCSVHELNADGTLGDILDSGAMDVIEREMDVSGIMSHEVARSMYEWLGNVLDLFADKKSKG